MNPRATYPTAGHLPDKNMWIYSSKLSTVIITQILQDSPVVSRNIELFPRMIAQVMEPLALLITMLDTICWIAGVAFLFGAIGRYMQYQSNPTQSPISQVFFLATLGIILLLLPTIGKYALPNRSFIV